MGNIAIEKTKIDGLNILKPTVFEDERGTFVKQFTEEFLRDNGMDPVFKESFYSTSKKDVIRGMHYHLPPHEHAKLVYVTQGTIEDVILDIRKESPTYGEWVSVELSETNHKSIYIPIGCAHGFKTLTDSATVIYLQTTAFSPDHDAGFRWDSFGYEWKVENPIISEKDQKLPNF